MYVMLLYSLETKSMLIIQMSQMKQSIMNQESNATNSYKANQKSLKQSQDKLETTQNIHIKMKNSMVSKENEKINKSNFRHHRPSLLPSPQGQGWDYMPEPSLYKYDHLNSSAEQLKVFLWEEHFLLEELFLLSKRHNNNKNKFCYKSRSY